MEFVGNTELIESELPTVDARYQTTWRKEC